MGGTRRAGPGPGVGPSSSGPGSSPPVSDPRVSSSPPGSPSDSEGWQKPAKVARRAVVEGGKGRAKGEGLEGGGDLPSTTLAFAPLELLGDRMEVGPAPTTVPESRMLDPDHQLLKRPRSPPEMRRGRRTVESRSSEPSSSGSSKSSINLPLVPGSSQGSSPGTISVSVPLTDDQVRPVSKPCMPLLGLPVVGSSGEQGMGMGGLSGEGGLVPVEVRLVLGVQGFGSEGGAFPAERGGGLDKGKAAQKAVGLSEVVGGELEGSGLFSSVRSGGAGGGKGGGGSSVRGGKTGRGSAVGAAEGGGRTPRAVRRGVGPSRALSVGALPRVRSRSPGGRKKSEGGGALDWGDAGGLHGSHSEVVKGVREALVTAEALTEGEDLAREGPSAL